MPETSIPHLSPLRRFTRLLSLDRREISYVYLYAIFNGVLNLSLPLGIQAIIGLILADRISSSWVILIVIVTIGTLAVGGLQIMQISITELLQQRLFTRASFDFAYRLPRIRMEALSKHYPPELINRFFDVMTVQKGMPKLLMDFSTALLQTLFGLILLSFYNSAFVFFSIGLVTLLSLIFRFTSPKGIKTSIEESTHKYEVAYWLEEIARTLGAFKHAGNDFVVQKLDGLVVKYLNARKAHFRVLLSQYGYIVGFKTIVTGGLLILGSLLLIDRQINIGQFVAAEIIILLLIGSVEKLILSMDTIYDVLTAIDKLGKITDLPLEPSGGQDYKTINPEVGAIAVRADELTFAFPGQSRLSLENINFSIKAGEKVCIAGYNASGKTVLLNILSGLYAEFTGGVSYNGVPLQNYNIPSLRARIGDTCNDHSLFRGTIYENITVGRKVDFQHVMWAIEQVSLSKFVQSLPKGLDTMVMPEGPQLPASVAQRLILARSIVQKPGLLLMDNIFQYLEPDIRRSIMDMLLENSEWTLMAISNNPVFAARCDRVLIFESGRLIDEGNFDYIKTRPYAQNIFPNA